MSKTKAKTSESESQSSYAPVIDTYNDDIKVVLGAVSLYGPVGPGQGTRGVLVSMATTNCH